MVGMIPSYFQRKEQTMIRMTVAILLVSVVLIGCGVQVSVREYCGQDMSYHIFKQEAGL